jgi:large subunit ribosomal protein L1
MPSPKNGTVTDDVTTAVAEFKAGKIEFRNDAGGNVHAVVGKQSFEKKKLVENVEAFINHIKRVKPAAAKGIYIRKACLSGTMTPAVEISV